MIYANDESDKALRKKHFILNCYVIPVLVLLVAIASTTLAYNATLISKIDLKLSFWLFPTISLMIYQANRIKWMKMPDGSYFSLNSPWYESDEKEPQTYEAVYRTSKAQQVFVVCYTILMAVSVVYVYKQYRSIILPVFFLAIIAFVITRMFPALKNTPKLKLAKEGLWTPKLGFRSWGKIDNIEVIEGAKGARFLKIYLHGTVFAKANVADDTIPLDSLKGKEYIETIVETLKEKRVAAIQGAIE